MKNLYLSLMLLVALPLSVLSQTALYNKALPQTKPNLPTITKQLENVNSYLSRDKNIFPKQMGSYKVIDTTIDVIFNSVYDACTPFVYEPKSKTLFYVQTYRARMKTSDSGMTGFVFIYWSQDDGATWSRETVYQKLDYVPTNMSIAVLNPNNSQNPSDFNYVLLGRVFHYNPAHTPDYDNLGGFYLLSEGTGFSKFDTYTEEGPQTNNPGAGQVWVGAKMISTENGGTPYMYGFATLSPKTNNQFGMYGFAYAGLKGKSINDFSSLIPTAWGPTNWRSTGDFNTSYNGPIYVDVDAEGTLYAAVNNFFAVDVDNRVLGISKSTDHGKTWSAFDKFPISIINDYIAANGYESAGNFTPYSTNGFAVTGKDQYSFVCSFTYVINAAASTTDRVFLEIFKENGNWQIRAIAPINGVNWRLPYFISDTLNGSGASIVDGFDDNPRGYEIQLSKTADGQNLFLKYIDNRKELGVLNPAVTLVNNGQIDSILTTDVYYAYRSTTGGAWTVANKSITDDPWMNKVTWIPNIIPSLNKIPLIEHTTVQFTNKLNPRMINKYPYWLQNYVVESGIRNLILFASFDAQNPASIHNQSIQDTASVSSVDDQLMPNFKLGNVSPNPVSGSATISFTLDLPANVKIELFNALGEKVQVISESQSMNPGFTGVSFNVNDLPTGTYYYTMTANGRSITKILNVVK